MISIFSVFLEGNLDLLRHFVGIIILLVTTSALAAAPVQNGRFSEGLSLFNKQQFKEAFAVFYELIQQQPQNPVYRYNLCQTYYKLGDYHQAISCYETVIKLRGKLSEESQFFKAISYVNLERENEAVKILTQLKNETRSLTMQRLATFALNALNEGSDVFIERAFKAYNDEKYQECLTQMNQSIFSDAGFGNMLKAMAYFSLGDTANGTKNLDLVILYSKDASLVETAQEMKIDPPPPQVSGASEISTNILASTHFFSDSNAYQSNSSPTAATGWQAQASIGLEVHVKTNESFGSNLNGKILQFTSYTDLNEKEYEIEFYYFVAKGDWRHYFAGTTLRTTFADVDSLVKNSFTYSFERPLAVVSRWFGDAQSNVGIYVDTAYQNSIDASFDYLRGALHKFKLYSTLKFDRLELMPFASYNEQHTSTQELTYGTLPTAFHGTGLGLNLNYKLKTKDHLQVNLNSLSNQYNPATEPNSHLRRDTQTSQSLRWNHDFNRSFSTFVEAALVHNASSLGDSDAVNKTYQQTTLSGGLSYHP